MYRDWARPMRRSLVRTTYEEIIARGSVPRETMFFTDHERMGPDLLDLARQLWDQVSPHCRCLNDPHKVLTRARLLQTLFDAGINSHRVFAPGDVPANLRFPVFVRGADDHLGPLTDLLPDRPTLEQAMLGFAVQGRSIKDLLVVEYEDARGPDGTFRKFSAFRLGDTIVPRHLIVGAQWVLKVNSPTWRTHAVEEVVYARDNPHAAEVRRAFELAGIEYGRIDYGLVDGHIRVWEINTNPTVMSDLYRTARSRRPLQREFMARYRTAAEGLDSTAPGPDIPLAFRAPGLAG